MNATSYAQQLKQLLPRGSVFLLETGSWVCQSLLAIADELARIDARGTVLIDETDPRTADETIEDWERILSLPDERVTAIAASVEERRIAITQKYIARGGQNEQYFIDLALACGYVVTVSKVTVLRVGFRVSDRVYGDGWAYAFQLDIEPPVGTVLPEADFERVIQHAVHSYATVIFNYL